jgi:hypothetical protein
MAKPVPADSHPLPKVADAIIRFSTSHEPPGARQVAAAPLVTASDPSRVAPLV